jgi:hypothetical protein
MGNLGIKKKKAVYTKGFRKTCTMSEKNACMKMSQE